MDQGDSTLRSGIVTNDSSWRLRAFGTGEPMLRPKALVLAMTVVLPLGLALGQGLAFALIPVGILLAIVVVVVVTHLTHSTHPLCRSRDSQQGSDEEC